MKFYKKYNFSCKILIIIGNFIYISETNEKANCAQLSTIDIHPLDCCVYPQLIDNPSNVIYRCTKLCKALPSPPFYCMRNCKISESGVISRGIFNASKAVDLFYEGGYADQIELTQKWKKIVKKSAENCESQIPIKIDIKDEDYNFFYSKFVECVRLGNFLDCPSYQNSTDCKRMKELMEKCDDENYLLLHELFFEDIYYRNVTKKWTTRTTTTGTPYPTEKISTTKIQVTTTSSADITVRETTGTIVKTTTATDEADTKYEEENSEN